MASTLVCRHGRGLGHAGPVRGRVNPGHGGSERNSKSKVDRMSEANDEMHQPEGESSQSDQAQPQDDGRTGEEQAATNLEDDPPA